MLKGSSWLCTPGGAWGTNHMGCQGIKCLIAPAMIFLFKTQERVLPTALGEIMKVFLNKLKHNVILRKLLFHGNDYD